MVSKKVLMATCPNIQFDHEYQTIIEMDLGDFGVVPVLISAGLNKCSLETYTVFILKAEVAFPMAGTDHDVLCNLEPILKTFTRYDLMDEIMNKFKTEKSESESP